MRGTKGSPATLVSLQKCTAMMIIAIHSPYLILISTFHHLGQFKLNVIVDLHCLMVFSQVTLINFRPTDIKWFIHLTLLSVINWVDMCDGWPLYLKLPLSL